MKRILVTAGSTAVPIDQVRIFKVQQEGEGFIANIFRGKTGFLIAEALAGYGHMVTLLTSGAHEKFVHDVPGLRVRSFLTFDELRRQMEEEIRSGNYDVVIHSAAVADYRVDAVRVGDQSLENAETGAKISSKHKRLIIEMVPTEKLIDFIREPWGFAGTLVKFKLEVGISDEDLLRIARRSMAFSRADLIVANRREWQDDRAYILNPAGGCDCVARYDLPNELIRRLA